MLYIKFVSSTGLKIVPWHVGEQLEHLRLFGEVNTITADGEELTWLYNRFPDLPKVNHAPVVEFPGLYAQFIYANMDQY